MVQDLQSRVEELEQNVQAKDRELARKVLLICYDSIVCVCVLIAGGTAAFLSERSSTVPAAN